MGTLRASSPGRSVLLRPAALAAASALAIAGAGCKGNPGPGLKIQAVEPARGHTCLREGKVSYPLVPLQDAGTLRVTVLRNDGPKPQLVCDTTANWPDERPNLDLGGDVPRERLSFFVELFAAGKRTWSGTLPGSASSTADGTAGVLPMFSVGDWNCPTTTMGVPRAFHTATVLPSGEVFLFGGVEALFADSPTNEMRSYGPDWFGVTNTAEIYDPVRLTFTDVTLPKAQASRPKPRAFHQIALVSATAEQVKFLVFGGLSSNLPGLPVLTTPDRPAQFRFTPAYFGESGGAELLVYDVASRSLSVAPLTGEMARSAFAGGNPMPGGAGGADAGLLVAGGVEFFKTGTYTHTPPMWTYVRNLFWFTGIGDPLQKASVMLPFDMLQPSILPLSPTTAVVLGAKVPTMVAEPLQMYAAPISGLPAVAQLGAAQMIQGTPTVGHTATRLADQDGKARVLLTGGFLMTAQPPPAPAQPPDPNNAARLYTIENPTSTASPVTLTMVPPLGSTTCGATGDRYRPAAYESAAATYSGQRALIAGGSPRFSSGVCNDCQAQSGVDDNPQCVLDQVFLYDAETNMLSKKTSMARPRMGHVLTLLPDGNILLTGGLVRPTGQFIETTSAASLFNSREPDAAGADPDDPVNAALTPDQQQRRRGMGLVNPCSRLK